jgi:alcohol dehydrogenase class IV
MEVYAPSMKMEHTLYEFHAIGRVLFGVGAADKVGDEAAALTAGRRCLIITDPGIVAAGLLERITAALDQAGFAVQVYAAVEPEPTMETYQATLLAARRARPDLLVGVGGGSSLDISKVVARAMCREAGPQFGSGAGLEQFVGQPFEGGGLPLITVPTTAGTGAEVTPDAVVLRPEERVKSCFLNVRASVAVVDPSLTLTLPARLTAATGIDALSHAIESALSKTATPLTQALALEAIRLISANLRQATFEGSNLVARTNLAWATLIEGFSESNAGDVEGHCVAHVLGGFYRVHHGTACGIALPACMAYNLPVNTPILARIGRALDEELAGSPRELAEGGIAAVWELLDDLGLPTTIGEIAGASRDDIPELARLYRTHPDIVEMLEIFTRRGVPSEEEAMRFFEEMF